MVESKYSLSWDGYHYSIGKGLSSFQQNGEFVDMTLAADGYHVKVHQVVMSLMSPYIKDLISSAHCPHPIIFLNQISYKTLCTILEYIYMGEVLVGKDELPSVIEAAKALKIQGLSDMDSGMPLLSTEPAVTKLDLKVMDSEREALLTTDDIILLDASRPSTQPNNCLPVNMQVQQSNTSEDKRKPSVQFTVSNRGNLQIILNRFMYHLRYSGRGNSHRRWLCVSHETSHKCSAAVITQGETVLKRLGAHNHGFHDEKIMKKVLAGAVYAAIHDAAEKLPTELKNKFEILNT